MFRIVLEPELPDVRPTRTEIDWQAVDWTRVRNYSHTQYNLIFEINDQIAAYYPAELSTVLGDLIALRDQLGQRRSDEFSIGGYPILRLAFEGDAVQFYFCDTHGSALGYPLPIAEVEAVGLEALRKVWSVVKAHERAKR